MVTIAVVNFYKCNQNQTTKNTPLATKATIHTFALKQAN